MHQKINPRVFSYCTKYYLNNYYTSFWSVILDSLQKIWNEVKTVLKRHQKCLFVPISVTLHNRQCSGVSVCTSSIQKRQQREKDSDVAQCWDVRHSQCCLRRSGSNLSSSPRDAKPNRKVCVNHMQRAAVLSMPLFLWRKWRVSMPTMCAGMLRTSGIGDVDWVWGQNTVEMATSELIVPSSGQYGSLLWLFPM